MGKITRLDAADARHGLSRHPLYRTWSAMMTRCYNPNVPGFKNWGGRDITVCDRWHDAMLFIEDITRLIGPRPPGKSLDRYPDNDGNYEPGNVRWATPAEQVRNSRKYIDGTRIDLLYRTWWRLMRRCPDEVCQRWHELPIFREDITLLGERQPGQRLDRLNDARPYEPGNVAWVTGAEQIKRARTARWGESRPEPKHGMFGHPLYNTWKGLVNKHPGRVHEPWLDVRVFVKDIEAELGPKPAGAAFRLADPGGRYEPGNIRWGKRGRPSRR